MIPTREEWQRCLEIRHTKAVQDKLSAARVAVCGLGGLGSAFFGWLADRTSIEFIFRVSALLPLMGIITGFLPDVERKR